MKKKKRKRRAPGKGSQYERDFCKQLSAWWAPGRDDIFWRSSQSGGRAKFRARKGKRTHGIHGDIAATDPIGAPLIDLLTIEVKRGYTSEHIADLLDRNDFKAQQTMEGWFQQAWESHNQSGSFAWMVVQRRDQRQPIVFMPDHLVRVLQKEGCWHRRPMPWFTIQAEITFRAIESTKIIKRKGKKVKKHTYRTWQTEERISATTLDNWLRCVTPAVIKRLSKIC